VGVGSKQKVISRRPSSKRDICGKKNARWSAERSLNKWPRPSSRRNPAGEERQSSGVFSVANVSTSGGDRVLMSQVATLRSGPARSFRSPWAERPALCGHTDGIGAAGRTEERRSQFSSLPMRRLNPDWVTLRSGPERETLRRRQTQGKSSSTFKLHDGLFLSNPRRAIVGPSISLQETRHLLVTGRFCRLSRSCVMFRIFPASDSRTSTFDAFVSSMRRNKLIHCGKSGSKNGQPADLQEPVLCFSKFDTFLEMEKRRGKPRMAVARPMTFNFAPSRGMLNGNGN